MNQRQIVTRENIKRVANFLKEAYKSCADGYEGCWFYNLDGLLNIVVSNNDENEVVAKIAYNIDDLQSDYDLDWYMPVYTDGEVADTEIALSKGGFRKDAEWFYKNFKSMLREMKQGNLLCKGN